MLWNNVLHLRTIQSQPWDIGLGVEGLYLGNILVEAIPAHNRLALPGAGTVVAEVVGHPHPVGSHKTTAACQSRKMPGRVFHELVSGGEDGFTHAIPYRTIALCLGYGSGRGTAMHHRDVYWELGGEGNVRSGRKGILGEGQSRFQWQG